MCTFYNYIFFIVNCISIEIISSVDAMCLYISVYESIVFIFLLYYCCVYHILICYCTHDILFKS